MRTDGKFTTKYVKIDWDVNRPLTLIPFGDIHHDSPAFSQSHWEEFLTRARGIKDALFLGMGDYFDGFSTTERAIIYDRNLHESTKKRQEKEQIGRIARLADDLEFMRGRLIGLIGGNHFSEFSDGTTSDMRLADKLGTTYLGACCAIRIALRRPGGNNSNCVDIFAHHGKGGGTTAGGKFNSVEKLASVCDADIYLMGDNHARGALPLGDRLFITADKQHPNAIKITSKTRWIGRTGSFLRAYVENESSYVVDAALQPANLGWIEFELTLKREESKKQETTWVQIKARQ